MTNQEIYNTLVEIQGQLEDSYYSLPDYNANSDGKSSLDGARCDVSHLMDEVERTILDENKVLSKKELEQVLNHPPVSLL
tara:strand:- start:1256 stop:1495 length:240 start_codon:yes stop_codon:yes gene_type:complete